MSYEMLFAQRAMDQTAVGVLIVIGVAAVLITVPTVLITQYRILRQRHLATELVRDLIAQGMSAADIERVLVVWSAEPDAVTKIYRRRAKEEEKQFAASLRAKAVPVEKAVPPANTIKDAALLPPIAG